MNIFDCTLRDCGNVVGNGFDTALTESMIRGLISCGITEIEFGNAKGLGAHDSGSPAPLSDQEYMELAAPYTGLAHLGMFLQSNYATPERVAIAKRKGLNFLRVGTKSAATPPTPYAARASSWLKTCYRSCATNRPRAWLI